MASACNGTLGEGLGHVTAVVGRDASTKEILQGYSVKTKCFVEKTKCLVVFSKCLVIFSKYYLVFSICLGAENRGEILLTHIFERSSHTYVRIL